MKNYLFAVFLLSWFCTFGQLNTLEFTTINYKPKTIRGFGLMSIGSTHPSPYLYLVIDSSTTKVSNTIPHPTKSNTYFIYLENAKQISLKADIPLGQKGNYSYTISNDDGSLVTEKDQKPTLTDPNNFGSYSIENKNIHIVITEKNNNYINTKTLIICNKKPQAPQIVKAVLVKMLTNKPVKTIRENRKGEVVYVERSTSIQTNISETNIPFLADRTHALLTIKPIDHIFLYRIFIKYKDINNNLTISKIDNVNWYYDIKGNLNAMLGIKNFVKPGKYEIIIYPITKEINLKSNIENAAYIKFSIKKPSFFSSTKNILKAVIFILVLLVLVFITSIILIKRRNRKKLSSEKLSKNQARLKLDTIRSQLNPHFLFNALAGIQNLMNQNKTQEANHYLERFARLTRNVLDQKENISLSEEKELLSDYLQMEQFRFGFNFNFKIDESLNLNNIEIPPMLLQPFVENAVKHGIAEKGYSGEIEVLFQKIEQDLVLKISDNGNGFDSNKEYTGLGLQLSKNRISLLNEIYPTTPILLEIASNNNGTLISITLKEWL